MGRRWTILLGGLVVALSSGSGRHALAGINVWNTNGPGGRSVHALAIDPVDPHRLYAGTFLAVFRSTDAGLSWNESREGFPERVFILALAVDPRQSGLVYAGTDVGLFTSDDYGVHWSRVETIEPFGVRALAVDPTAANALYAATSHVVRTTDGGATWAGNPTSHSPLSLLLDPVTPTTIYVGQSQGGVFKSTDSGGHWEITFPLMAAFTAFTALAIDARAPSTVYASTANCPLIGPCRGGVVKTTDGGAHWEQLATIGLPNALLRALVMDPTDSRVLYVGAAANGVFKSTDGGVIWNAINNGLTDRHVDALAIDPVNSSRIYAGTGNGVYNLSQAASCAGDCNGDGAVEVDELVLGTGVVLGLSALAQCDALDRSGDGGATIEELIASVDSALSGCVPSIGLEFIEFEDPFNGQPDTVGSRGARVDIVQGVCRSGSPEPFAETAVAAVLANRGRQDLVIESIAIAGDLFERQRIMRENIPAGRCASDPTRRCALDSDCQVEGQGTCQQGNTRVRFTLIDVNAKAELTPCAEKGCTGGATITLVGATEDGARVTIATTFGLTLRNYNLCPPPLY